MPSKTKTIAATLGTLLLVLCIVQGEFLIPHALADDKVITDTQGGIMESLLFLTGVLNAGAFLCLKLISYLSDPNIVFNINDTSGILIRIWRISRDIMNLIFAIILLIGSIMTIVLGKQEIVKQHITKFLLAVVLVNFSWFFPRVIFDVANVTTATIYGLPRLVLGTSGTPTGSGSVSTWPCVWRNKAGVAQNCVVMSDIKFFDSSATCPAGSVPPSPLDLAIAKVCFINYDSNANTAFGIINGLVLNHGRLMHLGLLQGAAGGGIGTTPQESLKFGFMLSLITFMHFMLVFPIAALAAILMIRIPVLWLTISFMPFMFIGFIVGEKFRVNTMDIFSKHFLTAAFLPALIAVPFSIGFIMLNTFNIAYPPAPPGLNENFPVIPEVRSWWDLIWVLIAFMVIWKGSRWAMKSDEIYSNVTEPIYQIGTGILMSPVKTPFIPIDTNNNGIRGDAGDRRFSISDIVGNVQGGRLPFGFNSGPQGGAADKVPGGGNPGVQNAASDINTKVNPVDFNKLVDSNVKVDQMVDTLRKINESVRANTGAGKNVDITVQAIQSAANAKEMRLNGAQIDEIKKKFTEFYAKEP
ncbi:hypothetical protein FJZ27_03935 [Candidatus Peribacteria bacterium]|nr:hypothetical protein [Candidatus Peribacteria bacterium]